MYRHSLYNLQSASTYIICSLLITLRYSANTLNADYGPWHYLCLCVRNRVVLPRVCTPPLLSSVLCINPRPHPTVFAHRLEEAGA